MKTYQTTWKTKKRKGVYKTKTLTNFHKAIHENKSIIYACTIETDSTIDFPLGLWAEIIAYKDNSNPIRNKPFKS